MLKPKYKEPVGTALLFILLMLVIFALGTQVGMAIQRERCGQKEPGAYLAPGFLESLHPGS